MNEEPLNHEDPLAGETALFSPLVETLTPVEVPHHIWNGLDLRLDGKPDDGGLVRHFIDSINFWKPVAIMALAAVIVLAFFYRGWDRPSGDSIPIMVAMVGAPDQAPQYLLSLNKTARVLTVKALRPATIPPGKSMELWMLPGEGKPPISCGLVPAEGQVQMKLPPMDDGLLVPGKGFAVSLEPEGGSPTGAPTGPVMYQGILHQI